MKKNLEEYSDVEGCPVRNVLDRIGDKWSMLILLILNDGGVLRFNEMFHYIGSISQKMLSTTLKTLETDGLVLRKVYPEVPPKVEYRLSERGMSLMPHLKGLSAWAEENMADIKKSQARNKRG
ncbi:transcriptional regulator [marine bacterium AO1-C]|nr:transcriptional regulator [marine bacterium AO1-C]